MQFQPSHLSQRQALLSMPHVAQLNPTERQLFGGGRPDLLAAVSRFKVEDGGDMARFIRAVKESVEAERGSSLDRDTAKKIAKMQTKALNTSDVKVWAAQFGELKAGAGDKNVAAPKTAAAITPAAAWFYYNVEKPQTGGGSGGVLAQPTALDTPTGGSFETPFYKKTWFPPVAVSAVLLTVGVAFILLKD